jgi:hypothetical protein
LGITGSPLVAIAVVVLVDAEEVAVEVTPVSTWPALVVVLCVAEAAADWTVARVRVLNMPVMTERATSGVPTFFSRPRRAHRLLCSWYRRDPSVG